MNPDLSRSLDDLFLANRILVHEGVLDGFGHVSVRNLDRADHYFMTRNNFGERRGDEDVVELDANSDPVAPSARRPSIERFIHGEIYRARPDVVAVVHTHAPALIPFGVSEAPLRPLYHMCGFLADGAPVFDIGEEHGMTNMLVTDVARGRSLARSLGASAVVLMRGHGATVVGRSIQEAVYRAIYATINAQLQPIAMTLGAPRFLADEEAAQADELHAAVLSRPWEYWKRKLGP
jgi:ribulose-5-phosphate 4-epimerase/fuculose-1-phosphate aldolase